MDYMVCCYDADAGDVVDHKVDKTAKAYTDYKGVLPELDRDSFE